MNCRILGARKEAMSAIICSVGGRENAAARLNMKTVKKFDNHAYQSAGCRPLTDAQIYQLEQVAGTTHYPSYIAGIYGGMFVPIAEPDSLDNVEMYTRCVKTAAKRGTVDQIIAQALEDGVINQVEADAILKADSLHMAARHAEVLAVIQLHASKSGVTQ
ncbi:YmfL family putative regulatory protein [Pseudomonas sp.]|uniref:YmfL family putative regulatory protein n=1 Tax=Pseudomonas sp. TaxID=306 RepID=UPI0031B63CBA